VTLVGDGRTALERGRELTRPAVIIMDPDLPDLRGSELLRSLRGERATRSLPVLVLTAKDSEADRVVAFELGADDFVGTPFSVRELLLRVRVQLRNRPPAPAGSGALEVGVLRLDRESHRAWVRDREISLSVREFVLLMTLMERSERVLSRNVLLDLVWGTSASVGVRAVDAYVTRLRRKLGEARDYVETVSSVGYRLKRPVGDRH
jgi:two-component system phosphate regulon response regulator PhoB